MQHLSYKNWSPILARMACFALLTLLMTGTGCRNQQQPASTTNSKPPALGATVIFPEHGAYTGAYIDFGETEDDVSLEAIEKFETMVGKHQAIIASSSYWGKQSFPSKSVEIIARHGSLPLLFWSPWGAPFAEERPPDDFRLENILAGKWDSYIDKWGDAARAVNRPLLVAWGLEMNGSWFPWSGVHYGGGQPLAPDHPQQFAGPELYKQAYRYVVARVRARGASQILWLFHVNNYSLPTAPWNSIANYYPGADYVDVLGMSAYGKLFNDMPWGSLAAVMDSAYQQLCALDPLKPVIMAEYGVGEFPRAGNKATWVTEALENLESRYTRVKAAVYWHERWQNKDETYSNLRINSSPEALTAFRQGMAKPFWVDTLVAR